MAGGAGDEGILRAWASDGSGKFDRAEIAHLGPRLGRGLVARQAIGAGEVVLRDKPAGGDAARLLRAPHALLRALPRARGRPRGAPFAAPRQRRPAAGRLPGGRRAPHADARVAGARAWPCGAAACGALFCSLACREQELARGPHRVLCAEMGGERRRHWDRFRAHARRHHENFLLAAQALAWAICQVAYLGVPAEHAKAELLPWRALPGTCCPPRPGVPRREAGVPWTAWRC
ncbi:unnamed protein product [Prorocentrum cordatum]|nr:unnamed protein product [Polarella glacialis]